MYSYFYYFPCPPKNFDEKISDFSFILDDLTSHLILSHLILNSCRTNFRKKFLAPKQTYANKTQIRLKEHQIL